MGITCNAKSNVYSSNANPNDAARIDYILFKNQSGELKIIGNFFLIFSKRSLILNKELDVKCVDYRNCLGRIPNVNLNYSDHEGVYGEFQIKKSHPGNMSMFLEHNVF